MPGVGIPKIRNKKDDHKVDKVGHRGQQVSLVGLDFPVYLSWACLERDGKRVKRFVISTKPFTVNPSRTPLTTDEIQ